MKLYKFRGIEDGIFERDLQTLVENQIYAASFKELNDPFEALFEDKIVGPLKTIGNNIPITLGFMSFKVEDLKKRKDKFGIFSLAKSFKSPVMWAHYSSNHKGYCIQYDINKLKEWYQYPDTVIEIEVNYKDEIPKLSLVDLLNQKVFNKMFGVKKKDWQHEKEARLIFYSDKIKNHPMSAIKSIYFGKDMSENHKSKIIEATKFMEIKFYQCYITPNTDNIQAKLIAENKSLDLRNIMKGDFKLLKTEKRSQLNNFHLFSPYFTDDQQTMSQFAKTFRSKFTDLKSNIYFYTSNEIKNLIGKYPLNCNEYIRYSDAFIAHSNYETPNKVDFYVYKRDSRYRECLGN